MRQMYELFTANLRWLFCFFTANRNANAFALACFG